MATKFAPATTLDALLSVPIGGRLVLPTLIVTNVTVREIAYQGVEQTVWDYTFAVAGETSTWRIEYSGRHHFKWNRGRQVFVKATIKDIQTRWRCIKISRPVEQERGDVPLFS